jgi:RimJ/RimL family protein N-acetyltransferase
MIEIPALTTERLLLRAFRADDFEAYAAIMADPAVTRFLGDGHPQGRDEAWRSMAYFLGHWELRGFGLWAVEERETGALAGRIGFLQPEGWPDFELAYTLAPAFQGRGYAREGARAALGYARETLGRERVISLIRPENTPSRRVAESFGATVEQTLDFFGGPALVYVYPPNIP